MNPTTDAAGRAALALAREAVERYVRTGLIADPPADLPAALRQPSGVFVTLRTGGRLRGCVGTVAPARADVAREIVASAIAAAATDPRFPPVRPGELGDLEYEVDVVEPLEAVKDVTDLEPRLYGVLVEADGRRGVLLPDLAGVDTAEQQVAIATRKAGLPLQAKVQLHRFRVRRFRETRLTGRATRVEMHAMSGGLGLSTALATYRPAGGYDELFGFTTEPLSHCAALCEALLQLSGDEWRRRAALAQRVFHDVGVTFTLTADEAGVERTIPFDPVPRVVAAAEWEQLTRGLFQRVRALNAFLWDVYHEQRCLRDGVVPRWVVYTGRHLQRPMMGVDPPLGVYTHVGGIDLVRDGEGVFRVLEDNVRVPSGVSYMLQNRRVMTRLFPELFRSVSVRSVDHYPDLLLASLRAVAPRGQRDPSVVVLTPGVYNSAYFEHAFLAQQMGVPLVEPDDLLVRNARCEMRTTRGPEPVDVIYRRIDDDFLDPLTFRSDSVLGVPGLMHAVRAGNLALANAPGAGIADDKVMYRFVPDLVRYYLGEPATLPNVDTYLPALESDRRTVLDNLGDLVVKAANESGGYGMLMGPFASRDEIAAFREKILARPRDFIAQPLIRLSTCPTLVGDRFEPRHVDLRPYILMGAEQSLVPGGLTRVALRPGSLVVNSSQGGGGKDTWVVE